MNIDFKGQVALITGATRGIGKQIADDLESSGAEVILTGSNPEKIDDLNRETEHQGKTSRKYMAVDFSDKRSTQDFLDQIGKMNKIDICINNAGINRINYIDETLLQDWYDVTAVNLEAPFLITRTVSKIMKSNGYGRIVNISSIFGVISKAKRSLYSISKFGLRGLTVSSALDLATHGILVNSVSPGFVLTELTKSILSKDEIENLAAQVPLQRFAESSEISKVVMFLASSSNTYITGQNITADGGFVCV